MKISNQNHDLVIDMVQSGRSYTQTVNVFNAFPEQTVNVFNAFAGTVTLAPKVTRVDLGDRLHKSISVYMHNVVVATPEKSADIFLSTCDSWAVVK